MFCEYYISWFDFGLFRVGISTHGHKDTKKLSPNSAQIEEILKEYQKSCFSICLITSTPTRDGRYKYANAFQKEDKRCFGNRKRIIIEGRSRKQGTAILMSG